MVASCSMSQADPEAPIVADRYRLTRMIGRGGMGSVWEGVHVSLGTRVAVKFIDGELALDHDAQTRFHNEARAAARLQTKHVVQIFDHGTMPDGRPYIVMEFLVGEPLDARLTRERRLPPGDVYRIFSEVAKGLTKAHEVGVVHRDLKPENVFLCRSEDGDAEIAKVVDFGIAKLTQTAPGASSATRTGTVIGTPYYMSPEQVRGLRSLDHRADIWALAVVVYQCLTGELPFVGESAGDLMVRICVQPPPVPSHVAPVPPGFDAWFARSLQQEPGDRFQSVSEQAAALGVALGVSQSMAVAFAATPAVVGPSPGGLQTPTAQVGMGTQASYEVPAPPMKSTLPLVLVGVALGAVGIAVGAYFALRPASPTQGEPAGAVAATSASAGVAASTARADPPPGVDAVTPVAPASASATTGDKTASSSTKRGAKEIPPAGRPPIARPNSEPPAPPTKPTGQKPKPDGTDLGY